MKMKLLTMCMSFAVLQAASLQSHADSVVIRTREGTVHNLINPTCSDSVLSIRKGDFFFTIPFGDLISINPAEAKQVVVRTTSMPPLTGHWQRARIKGQSALGEVSINSDAVESLEWRPIPKAETLPLTETATTDMFSMNATDRGGIQMTLIDPVVIQHVEFSVPSRVISGRLVGGSRRTRETVMRSIPVIRSGALMFIPLSRIQTINAQGDEYRFTLTDGNQITAERPITTVRPPIPSWVADRPARYYGEFQGQTPWGEARITLSHLVNMDFYHPPKESELPSEMTLPDETLRDIQQKLAEGSRHQVIITTRTGEEIVLMHGQFVKVKSLLDWGRSQTSFFLRSEDRTHTEVSFCRVNKIYFDWSKSRGTRLPITVAASDNTEHRGSFRGRRTSSEIHLQVAGVDDEFGPTRISLRRIKTMEVK